MNDRIDKVSLPIDENQDVFSSRREKQTGNSKTSAPVDFEQTLLDQVENWRKRLLDLGNRNALINCSLHPSRGALEIVYPVCESIWSKLVVEAESGSNALRFPWRRDLVPPPPPEAASKLGNQLFAENDSTNPKEWTPSLEACLASRRLRDDDMLTPVGDKAVDRRLRTLSSHATLSLSEQGVHCLYAAFGFLKWFESVDSDQELRSPLILIPVRISRISADAPWELEAAEDEAIGNLCLRQRLKQDFGLNLPLLPDMDEIEDGSGRIKFLDAVRDAIVENDRWEVEDRCALGRFAFPKVAMWKDLGDHAESVIAHALCRSIGGDSTVLPRMAFGASEDLPDASKLDDEVPPGEVTAILDCDSSQLEAIVAARRGVSFVLDGPPGTGKSQTIANIIADSLAEGRTVLFVSEKVSALEVVKRRLDDCGLGDFCLECHSSKANRKTVLDELQWCLDLPAEVYDDATPKLEEAKRKRDALNEYVRSIHRPRDPLGLSPYELYGHVTRTTRLGLTTKSRCTLPDISTINRSTLDSILHLLDRANDVENLITGHATHPWRGCRLASRSLSLDDDVKFHFGVLIASFQKIETSTRPLIRDGHFDFEITPKRLNGTVKLLRDLLTAPMISPSWCTQPKMVAENVLRLCDALDLIEERSALLGNYSDEVVDRFPIDDALMLSESAMRGWITRLKSPVASGLRVRNSFLRELTLSARNIALASVDCEAAFSNLLDQLTISLKSKVPVSSIPKFVNLSRVVAVSGTMRPEWFETSNWARLRQFAEDAIWQLDQATVLTTSLGGRIAVESLGFVAGLVEQSNLRSAWERIQPFCPDGNHARLDELLSLSVSVARSLSAIKESSDLIANALGFAIDSSPSLLSLSESGVPLREIANAGSIHGSWVDGSIRIRIRDACKSSIADLAEAAELKESLQERLSHRAFKTTAENVATDAARYESFFSRMFGKFAEFRTSATDLYRDGLPDTRTLLADCARLRKFHRRLNDVREAGVALASFVPANHLVEDSDAWQKLDAAIRAFDNLCHVMPNLKFTNRSPTPETDVAWLEAISLRLDADLKRFLAIIENTPLASWCRVDASISELERELASIVDAIKIYQHAYGQVATFMLAMPSNVQTFLEDVQIAVRHTSMMKGVSAVFDRERDLMPPGTFAGDRNAWLRLVSGIDSAERICGLVRTPGVLKDALCTEGGIDSNSLRMAADNTEKCFHKLANVMSQLELDIDFTPPEETSIESKQRTLSNIEAIATACAEELAFHTNKLGRLIDVLRDGRDVQIDQLAADASTIADLRPAIKSRVEIEQILRSNGVDSSSFSVSENRVAASWILNRVNTGEISPLMLLVASDPDERRRVTAIYDDLKLATGDEFKKAWAFLTSLFDIHISVSTGLIIIDTAARELAEHFCKFQNSVSSLDEWLQFSRWRGEMRDGGIEPVVEELIARRYDAAEAADVIAGRLYRSLFDHMAVKDRTLSEFDLDSHERCRERFQHLDEWEIKAAATRIRQFQLGREDRPRPGWAAPGSSEVGIVQREAKKKRRHMPLRKLFAEIPGVLQRLKPCIMMSPLSVSTFLESEELRFDLVIFDEASQVFPWDAIGAIYRGSQLIVAGDEQQLPPSNFFNRADIESDEEEDDIADFESILSLCKSINMPRKGLKWHYRSRREPLIAFSNQHFYNGDLVTFPSVLDASSDAVRLEFVRDGRWVNRRNLEEAERIADLVIAHLRTRPETSLGVIAFNVSQQQAIEDAIYDRRRRSREIDELFDVGLTEAMFIKNLENVQGDERDVIILSMGYAFNEAGKFLKNFGPLTKAGGERRLNVAVTRAREEVVLVASVRSADMDLTESKSEGSHLLKHYLEYAESGVDSLARRIDSLAGESESPFEHEVATALVRRGMTPVPQVGCGGFRIDLALKHPQRTGEFCLGIECDGATYHSGRTARDRDRIRHSVLEGLGWRIVRIWSTDWIRNPERQLDRILAAFELAVTAPKPSKNAASDADEETDGLQPRFVEQQVPTGKTFANIDSVPDEQIRAAALVVLVSAGATDWDELIKLVARELGFARTGRKIRERLEIMLHNEVRSGTLRRIGDRVVVQNPSK